METFNLFANFDEFSANVNNSFADLEGSTHEIVELPEDIESKKPRVVKSLKRKNTRSSKKEEFEDIDDPVEETDTVVSPGVGQITAYKKLNKHKKKLETLAIEPTKKTKTRSTVESLRAASQSKRSKRARVSENAQIECIELDCSPATSRQNIAQDTLEDEDLSLSIKLKWEGTPKLEKIPFSLYKPFSELTAQLSTREKVDAKLILLMIGNNVIKPDDSPHSIGYTLGKFISVRVVDNANLYVAESKSTKENTIEIKIQSNQWKKPILCNIKITDQFKVLAGICSEKLKCRADKLRFKFDGDLINISTTPGDLEFEGGEVLDIIIAS